jgi:stage II sporulation protein D
VSALRLLAGGIAVTLAAFPAVADDAVRVRIAAGASSVRVSGRELAVDGRHVKGDSLEAIAQRGVLRIRGSSAGAAANVSARGALNMNGRSLPGSLRLIAGDGGVEVVNLVPLEPYIASSVASETPADWPSEALKAQAVAARSYALYQQARHSAESYDLESSVISQRYAAGATPTAAAEAVRATEGEYLAFQGEPILAVFHSSSGGATASAEEVWGEAIPYLQSVSSPDDGAPDFFWSYQIELTALATALREAGYSCGSLDTVRVSERSSSGRVERIQLGSTLLSGRDLREVLGGRALRSALFEVRREGDRVSFLGSGSGHGVGLCQWGASQLARRGQSYRQILSHYYPGTQLRHLGSESWSARR